jgi:hypothetical protein
LKLLLINVLSPCFDEPAFKAEYVITIEHPLNSIAVSNFPVDTSGPIVDPDTGNKVRTTFVKTYAMSAYLVSWAILPDDFAATDLPVGLPNGAIEVLDLCIFIE